MRIRLPMLRVILVLFMIKVLEFHLKDVNLQNVRQNLNELLNVHA